jgi:hypothetical protein
MKKVFAKKITVSIILILLLGVSIFISLAYTGNSYSYTKKLINSIEGYKNFSTYIYGTFLNDGKTVYNFESISKFDVKNLEAQGNLSLIDSEKIKNYLYDVNDEEITLKNEIDKTKSYKIEENLFDNKVFKKSYNKFSKSKINEKTLKSLLLEYYLKEYKDVIKERELNVNEKEITIELMEERLNQVILRELNNKEEALLNALKSQYLDMVIGKVSDVVGSDLNKYKLVDDVKVTYLNVDFILDKKNLVKNLNFNCKVNGKTKDGKEHEQEYDFKMKFYDVNKTEID